MRKMTKIDNKGFSLVELVIVMAIILILGGVAFTGLSLLTSRPVDECARKIQMVLQGNRNTTMGKFSGSVKFTADSDGVYVEEIINGVSDGRVLIGQSGVSVSVVSRVPGDAATTTTTVGATPIEVSFNRSDGSLKSQAGGAYITSFVISRGSTVMTVTVDRLTGRVDLE